MLDATNTAPSRLLTFRTEGGEETMKTEMTPVKGWGLVNDKGILRYAARCRYQARERRYAWEHIVRVEIRELRKAAKKR